MIILLVLLVLGLYFYPSFTKNLIDNTASVISEIFQKTGSVVKEIFN